MWQTTQALSHYRRLLSDPWEMTSLPDPRFPWPHHVPHHLCVNIKSSISGKAAAEWLMLCLSARRRQGRQSKCEDGPVLVQWPPHTHCETSFNHSHGSYSGQQAWCLQFPRPLLKNDTFSDQMLQPACRKLWLLAGPSFLVQGRLFLTTDES